jgi:hypothetical protein
MQDKSYCIKQTNTAHTLTIKTAPYTERSLMVSGLPEGVFDLVECQAVEFTLLNLFLDFGTESVAVVPGYGRAYVRFAGAASVALAIEELDGAAIQAEGEGEEGAAPLEHTLQLTAMEG